MRAGRVIVPILALVLLIQMRRRLLGRELIGVSTCFITHAALVMGLLYHWGYVDKRHTLVLVALLLPFAAMFLAQVRELARANARRWLWPTTLVICLAPLAGYSLRIPNGETGFLRRGAAWLTANRSDVHTKLLSGGSSQRRIAFYADMRWKYWLEDPQDFERIHGEMLYQRPDYFALEVGPGFERRRNDELIKRLEHDPEIGPVMREVYIEPAPRDGRLLMYELSWPGS